MFPSGKQNWMREKARQNRASHSGDYILWSRHAIAKLVTLALSRIEVERALEECEIIEDYQAIHRPLPDCLVLGFLASGKAVHVVVAIDQANDRLFVVTVYFPFLDRWQDDQRTRK